jgi:hypothetical protein
VTSRELIRWSTLHERRARAGRWWRHPAFAVVVGGGLLAAWVWWRSTLDVSMSRHVDLPYPFAASKGWLAGAIVVYAIAFMRVPFHVYWRQDAALLAQLPIEGRPLFDAALYRCVRAAVATTAAVLIGALPLVPAFARADVSPVVVATYHGTFALVLGACAGLLLPAVVVWTASLVAHDGGASAIRTATKVVGVTGPEKPAEVPSTALLGAVPGFASAVIIVLVILVAPWLTGGEGNLPAVGVLPGLAIASVVAIVAVRRSAARAMGAILRDVSALDRQRLAHLEIKPPTPIERALAHAAGRGAIVYRKDARLMRRRFPLAYAFGALAFVVLAIVGLARPTDATPWLAATLVAAAAYGLALDGRLHAPPIELPRLTSTLPIAAVARAKLVWIAGWWTIFIAIPGAFAAARLADPVAGGLIAGATLVVLAGASIRRL